MSVTDHKLDTARDLTWREPLPETAGVRAMLSAILTFMLRRMRRLSFALTVRAFSFSDRLGRCILHFSLLKERVDPDAPWHNPESLSSAWLISRFPRETAFVSLQIAASDTFLFPHAVSAWRQLDTTRLESMASSYFEIGRFHRAKEALECAAVLHFRSPYFSYMLGSLYLLAGDESKAAACAREAVKLDPGYLAPSEYFFLTTDKSPPYRPTQYDTVFGEDGLLRSLYDSTGQRVLHVGAGQLRPLLHSKAMEKRAILRKLAQPSPSLARFLSERNIDFQQMHVLPWEWTSQIGHLGMLEIMLRMRKLGWWEGHAILLTHENQIANRTFLSLLEDEAGLTIISDSHNDVSRELASLLPSHGMPYYAWRYPNAQVVPWHEAAALAICEWERQNLGYPLRGVFDRKFGDDTSIVEKARDAFREWGIGPNDWYVCVHMREPSYIGADADRGQNNRNANPKNYEEALRYITSQGGWVLKLGAPQSPPLPGMERVVDYARSRHKSDSLDIYLIRHAKFFVGTTSGLVNVAVSFGLPTAQVNCLTTESQLWHSGVRFCLKPIVRADGRMLTQKELISSQWRWGLFTVDTMRYYNLTAADNSSDEILETVREVHSIAGGAKYMDGAEDVRLREQWKNGLEVRHHYGCALPSAYFLRKHGMRFLA
ncbi:putative glycosyltransferase, TIGR04372 family [Bradyrhizobium erythrophlei]|nr:putative glycosyltransferase, TIGR04372 family [Bradyrhizobium erythrophlei]